MKKLFLSAAVVLFSAPWMVADVSAQAFSKGEDAVQYRQGAFQIMRAHFGALQPVVRGQVPFDQDMVVGNIEVLEQVSKLPWAAFGPGTQGGGARADIWSDTAGFEAAQQAYLETLPALMAAAKEGSQDRLRQAFANTGASCKACHDSFRR